MELYVGLSLGPNTRAANRSYVAVSSVAIRSDPAIPNRPFNTHSDRPCGRLHGPHTQEVALLSQLAVK